jgi:4-hydroxybenzoate polyprenyltransferase
MLGAFITGLRPRQWTKNLLVFAGLIFSQGLNDPTLVARSVFAFAIFCLLSGSVYLINDVMDAERDRAHPQKRFRPVASGRLPAGVALVGAIVLLVGSSVAALFMSGPFGATAVAYAALQIAYSMGLKHVVILDSLIIAGGFVLRALAGVLVLGIELSHWLLLCTILLALFLTFGKRRHELIALEAGAADHRPILSEYSPQLLDQMIAVVTASTLMAYALYTMAPETQAKLGTTRLPLTIPFVLYGIFRYLYLLYRRDLGGDPSEHLVTDWALLVDVALWGCAVVLILYVAS